MSSDINLFVKELDSIEEKIEQDVNDRAKGAINEIFNALLEPSPKGTPVKSGLMRSNWMVGLDGTESGVTGSKNNVTYSSQESTYDRLQRTDLADVDVVYIYNNVPYFHTVNYGTVKQSPLMFAELSIDRGIRRGGNIIDG